MKNIIIKRFIPGALLLALLMVLLIQAGAESYPPVTPSTPALAAPLRAKVPVAQSANYQLLKQVISGAALDAASPAFQMKATLGQTATGPVSSTNYRMSQGFWEDFGSLSCCVKAGDANHSGVVNIQDITYVINFLYKSGPKPPCQGGTGKYPEADANGNGITNIQDITYLINFLYKAGLAPICGPM